MDRQGSTSKKYKNQQFSTPNRTSSLIENKLESIKREIERQYNKHKPSTTSKEKENPKKSILETKKLKKAIFQSEQQRFKDKYHQLQEEYLQQKKQFLLTIERFNTLKSSIEAYLKCPFSQNNTERLRQFYLNQAAQAHIDKIIQLGKENESLKSYVQRMLEIFQMNDFQEMIKQISEIMQSSRGKKERESVQVQRLRNDLLQRGREIQRILDKLDTCERQIDKMRYESQRASETIYELERLNDKQQQARQLIEEQMQQIALQKQKILKQNQKYIIQIADLKDAVDKIAKEIIDLEEERQLLRLNIDQQIGEDKKIQALVSQNNSLIQQLAELRIQLNTIRDQSEKYAVKSQQELSMYKSNFSVIQSQLNCSQLEVIPRIKILLKNQQQLNVSSGLLDQFSKNIQKLIDEIKEHKRNLEHTSVERDEYKFLLNSLNKQIDIIRKQEKDKTAEFIQKGENQFKKSAKQLTNKHQTMIKEVEQYKHQIQFYKKESESLLNRNEKLSVDLLNLQEEIRGLRVDSSKLKIDMETIVTTLKEAQQEKDKLDVSLKNITKQTSKQIQSLKKQLQKTSDQLLNFRTSSGSLKNDLENNVMILKQELRVAESNVALRDEQLVFKKKQFESQLQSYKKTISDLGKTNAQSSTLMLKLNHQLQELKIERDKIRQQKNQLQRQKQNDRKNLQQQLENFTIKLEEIIDDNNSKKQMIVNLQQEIVKGKKQNDKVNKKCQQRIKMYQKQSNQQKQKLREKIKQNQQLRVDLQIVSKQCESHKSHLLRIKNQKSQSSVNKQIIQNNNNNIHMIDHQKYDEIVSLSQKLKYQNIQKQNQLLELEDINSNLNVKVSELQSTIQQKTDHIRDMNIQLTSFKDSMEELLEEAKTRKLEINQLKKDINNSQKYIDAETDRIKEIIRLLGEDQDADISRFDEIKEVYKNYRDPNLAKLKKNVLQLSMVQAPKVRFTETLSPCSSIGKDFNFKPSIEDESQLQKLRNQNQNLRIQLRSMQKKVLKLQNDQNSSTLKAMVSKFFDALLSQDQKKEGQIIEATRIILKVLDFSNAVREDIIFKITNLRKKKGGFFSFLK